MSSLKSIVGMLGLVTLGAGAADGVVKKPEQYKAELILEIRDERLRVFQYQTPALICHISIIDVKMIGAQASVSCVRKDADRDPTHRRSLPR